MFKYAAVLLVAATSLAQEFDYGPGPARPAPSRVQPNYSGPSQKKAPAPVQILKQIDRHNDDGSYTYGYESADGSFKIETKLPTGEVKGKYGYVDDVGKVRVVDYGATKYGFAPAGEGITVAPPTLVDETTDRQGNFLPEYSGAYYNQDQDPAPAPARSHAPRPRPPPPPSSFDSFGPASFDAPPPPRSHSPAPPRPSIPGAAPVRHGFDDDFPSRSFAAARPAPRPAPRPAAPRPPPVDFSNAAPVDDYEQAPVRSAPRITYAQPAAAPARPAPAYAPRPAPSGRGSILDQLSKDYALPSNGAQPLHDISFGYY